MKRIAAFIISLTMLFSYVPLSFAAGDIVLDFTKISNINYNKPENIPSGWDGTAGGFSVVADETNSTRRSGRATKFLNSSGAREDMMMIDVESNSSLWPSDTSADDKFTVEADISNAGWYTVKLRAGQWYAGGWFYIFVNGRYAGLCKSYDGRKASEEIIKMVIRDEEILNTLYLSPNENGKVKISFVCVKKSPEYSDLGRLCIQKLTLSPCDSEPEFDSIADSIPDELDVGDSMDFDAYASLSNGAYLHEGAYNYDGTESSGGIKAEVTGGDAVSLTEGTDSYLADGKLTGKIKGEAIGTAEITISATVGGVLRTKKKYITVTEPQEAKPFEIEMTRDTMTYTDKSAPSADWQTQGFDIVLEKTTNEPSRYLGFKVNSEEFGLIKPVQLAIGSPKNIWPNATNAMFTIRKKVPASGYYKIDMYGIKWFAGSTFAVYVNGNYAGQYSCYDPEDSEQTMDLGPHEILNTIYIPKGNAEISFRPIRVDYPNGVYFAPYKISFTPVDIEDLAVEKIEVPLKNKLVIGEDENVSASVIMNDGSVRRFGLTDGGDADASNKAEVTSSDSSVASVKDVKYAGIGDDGKVNFTVSPVKLGNADITIKATVDGKEYTETVSVEVIDTPKLASVGVSFEKAAIPASRKTNTVLLLVRSDDEVYTDTYVAEYESLNPETAVVDPVTGEVTGVSEGVAEIKVKVVGGGVTVYGTGYITVTAKPVLDSVSVSADRSQLLVGEMAKISVSGKMNDATGADMSSYSVTYKSANTAVATVDESGIISAVGEGSADVYAYVQKEDGGVLSEKITVNVFENLPNISVDFTKTTTEKQSTWVYTSTPGYTVLEGESYQSGFRNYKYPNGRTLLHIAAGMREERLCWPNPSNLNRTLTIEVDIPFESDYGVTLSGGEYYAGAAYSVFVDGKYLGDHNFYNPRLNLYSADTNVLNTVHLTAGKHKVSFRMCGIWREQSYLLLDTLTFIPRSATPSIEDIEIQIPEKIAVGEKFTGNAVVRMSDGTARYFGPDESGLVSAENTLSAAFSSDSAELTGFIYTPVNSSNNSFSILGKKAGTVEFEISANVNGSEKKKKFEISVENDALASAGVKTGADEIFVDESVRLIPVATLESGRILDESNISVKYTSENTGVAQIEDNLLNAVSVGKARIKAEIEFNGVTKVGYLDVEVLPESMSSIEITAGGSKYIRITDKENDTVPLYVTAKTNLGNDVDLSGARITAEALTPEYAIIDNENNILGISEGEARFRVTVDLNGRIIKREASLTAAIGKSKATYKTAEKAAAARENVKKYSWTQSEVDSYINRADKYVDSLDAIYNMIASEGIPRATHVGSVSDPLSTVCRYCNTELAAAYGLYPWLHNPLKTPWKIQCPECKRIFPSNDFGSFYKLGLNEYGEFDRTRALEAHAKLFGDLNAPEGSDAYYGYGKGYLKNDLYPEVASVPTINGGEGLREGESAETWGVDDGMGYVPKDKNGNQYKYSNGVGERHTYIAEYLHYGVWRNDTSNGGVVSRAIKNCAYAYFYTGDKKYGRVAAILLDRVADFYPGYDLSLYGSNFQNSHGGLQIGKTIGCIWETGEASDRATAYDMVFDMYDDPYVLNYIKNKSSAMKMRHAKNTASQIRTNIEDGLLRTMLDGLIDCSISGNFGMPQMTNAVAAVVLDTMPDTKKWLDYLMAPGFQRRAPCLGGGINVELIDNVDADGQGNEASSYNVGWHTNLINVANVLESYDRYDAADLYKNPKFVKMFYSNIPLMSSGYTPQIGDSSRTLETGHWANNNQMIKGFLKLRDPVFAQVLYLLNGNSEKGLHYDIETADPERLEKEVKEIIDACGTLNTDSELMSNFGFAILRDGGSYETGNIITQSNTQRDTWMYFGSNSGHGHRDTLNLGMTAFGLNFMPDLGYPELTGSQPNRLQWVSTTLSHNTVMVDVDEISGGKVTKTQLGEQKAAEEPRGNVYHFDDTDTVKLVDVDASYVYDKADIYRRSLVTVKVDDETSYTVDFFRVLGGDEHLYSIHATSNKIAETSGLNLVPQADENGNYVGSYAGADVPFGKDPNSPAAWTYYTVYPRGFTWLNNVDRADAPEDKFEVDFEIKDFKKTLRDSRGLRMRMTMLDVQNDGVMTDVAIADGYPPQRAENKSIDRLKYVLVKNKGTNLDDLFTAVYEPYRNTRYVKDVSEVETSIVSGTENSNDRVRALCVEHTSGRKDYIVYATNNSVKYNVGGVFEFSGFIGVYTLYNGECIYSYINDGTQIGEKTFEKASISGKVSDFTREYAFENEILFRPDSEISDSEMQSLEGRYVHVDNGDERGSAYKILGAERRGNEIALDIGDVTLIRKHVDSTDESKGYLYNIAKNMSAVIPLSFSDDNAPVFESTADKLTVTAGSFFETVISAKNADEEKITYTLKTAPSGARMDSETGAITWKPDASQVGDNHFAVTATDESGRESTLHFTVTVYGSTTPSGGGGAGGGGGGGTPATTPEPEPTPEPTPNPEPTPGPTPGDNDGGFIDIDNYAWAKDSINALADAGIIKGTSEDTFSPSSNITRADFAILLVRAFELTGEGKDNFNDVDASDYFAHELAIAKENGIVGGIGDNKYAPRNTITRGDMMVIVYRALLKLGYELKGGEITAPDFESVSDYAKEAVSALVANGLVNGKNGLIDSKAYTTRAEVAVLVKRILDFTEKQVKE